LYNRPEVAAVPSGLSPTPLIISIIMHGEKNAYKIFVGKPEGKGLPGRHKHKWEDNI
jgi:hypothetical protein